ncbi:hypothetical protein QR66_09880 [Chromobacterium piscinae]|nr:hypothetical protein QR66_09880 [Chromobacterium piscinae]
MRSIRCLFTQETLPHVIANLLMQFHQCSSFRITHGGMMYHAFDVPSDFQQRLQLHIPWRHLLHVGIPTPFHLMQQVTQARRLFVDPAVLFRQNFFFATGIDTHRILTRAQRNMFWRNT